MDAFFLIDKPLGITSFDVIRQLRKGTGIRKIGHTGTLDPLATGLLLVAFGNYTKLIPYFEKDKKIYEFTLSLEGTTESLDSETPLIVANREQFQKNKKELSIEKIKTLLNTHFLGEIEQIPPKYSALKINGKKAVDLVRAGKDFEMKKRKSTIYTIELLAFDFPNIRLRAEVSAGTYIRTIAGDLGNIIGTGAHVTMLRRLGIGSLRVTDSQKLENFDITRPLVVTELLSNYKTIDLDTETIQRINYGQRVRNIFEIEEGEYFIQNKIGITHVIEVDSHILKMKRKISS